MTAKMISSAELTRLVAMAKAYVEGRVEADPTEEFMPSDEAQYARSEAIAHYNRVERNRVARANAMRHSAGRDCGGELVASQPTGEEEVGFVLASWDELLQKKRSAA